METKAWLMAGLLVFIIVVSLLQAVELAALKDKVTGDLSDLSLEKKTTQKTSTTQTQASTNLKKNIESLKGMVGGC